MIGHISRLSGQVDLYSESWTRTKALARRSTALPPPGSIRSDRCQADSVPPTGRIAAVVGDKHAGTSNLAESQRKLLNMPLLSCGAAMVAIQRLTARMSVCLAGSYHRARKASSSGRLRRIRL